MSLDFTYNKYKEIITAIAKSDYEVITINDYIVRPALPEKFIIIRHDVDLDPFYQLKFAELEQQHGIYTSYYFRYVDKVYKKEIIDQVFNWGHEVGYHYEVFTKARGNESKAIEIFRDELQVFQNNWNIKTICPHGGSFVDNIDGYALKDIIKLIPKLFSGNKIFSNWSNFDLWSKYRFEDFQLNGDAYKSIDFSDILYLSDTGRSWDHKYKRLDKVNSKINPEFLLKKSDEIIRLIKNGAVNKIYLLVHFEQWKDKFPDWLSWYAAQIIRRNGKKILFGMKKNEN